MLNFSALPLYSQWWVALDIAGRARRAPADALPKFAERIAGALPGYPAPRTISWTRQPDPTWKRQVWPALPLAIKQLALVISTNSGNCN